jgi:hypothetical protein
LRRGAGTKSFVARTGAVDDCIEELSRESIGIADGKAAIDHDVRERATPEEEVALYEIAEIAVQRIAESIGVGGSVCGAGATRRILDETSNQYERFRVTLCTSTT